MDRGVRILHDEPLADEDGVLEVVAPPRHEGDQDVAPEREFAVLRRGPVGEHVAFPDPVAHPHDRALVDAGPRVRAEVLDQPVGPARVPLAVVADDDLGAVRVDDLAGPLRERHHAGVARDLRLEAGHDDRGLGGEERDRLALHVRTHQGPVGVVVLEERDQPRRHAHELLGRDVDELDLPGGDMDELAALPGRDQLLDQAVTLVHLRVRLGDDVRLLLVGGEPDGPPGHVDTDLPVAHLPVRRLEEAVAVHAGEGAERGDEADVGPLRRLDRADAPVVARVDVADLEAGAVAAQTARAQRREPPLVRDLGERVRLVHELGKLAAAEEVADHAGERLGVDEPVRGDRLGAHVVDVHPLLGEALHPGEADAALVLEELAHRADPAVAEVIDVVEPADLAVAQAEEIAARRGDVLLAEDPDAVVHLHPELLVQLEPADPAEVVVARVEEDPLEHRPGARDIRRVPGTEALVDLLQRLVLRVDLALPVPLQHLEHAADPHLRRRHRDALHPRLQQRRLHGLGELPAGDGEGGLRGGVDDPLDDRALRERFLVGLRQGDLLPAADRLEDRLVGNVARRAEKGRGLDLAPAPPPVDVEADRVVGVEFALEPRAAVRDDPEPVARHRLRARRLLETDPRRAVELADDDAFGAVDDERPLLGHQRDAAEVDRLLLDVAALAEAEGDPEGRRVGEAAPAALDQVVLRTAEIVAHVFEGTGLVVALDREDLPEDLLKPLEFPPGGEHVGLQELLIGLRLDLDEVGHRDQLPQPRVIAHRLLR